MASDFGSKLKDVCVKEYGISVPIGPNMSDFLDGVTAIQKARDEALDWMAAKTMHSAFHEGGITGDLPADPGCYFCSWAYKFRRFWYEVWWNLETCDGCGKVMYECGSCCEFWADY